MLESLTNLTDEELAAKAEEAQEALYAAARENFTVFCELVAKDDETGLPIKLAPIHKRWSQILDKEKRVILWSSVHSGKTTICSILRPVWELGRDTSLRIAICSSTGENAEKIVSGISSYIQDNDDVKKVFPKLIPDLDKKWTKRVLTVHRKSGPKDPSVCGFGAGTKISGRRVDIMIIDDALDQENTVTAMARDKMKAWYKSCVPGRLSRRGKIWAVGTAWHPDDLYAMLRDESKFPVFRFPAIDKNGIVSWPENYPPERIAEKKRELGPLEFARQMLCRVHSSENARFQEEWFKACKERGIRSTMVEHLLEVPEGCKVYTGVDLAAGKKNAKRKKSDLTVLFTVLLWPNGDRQILNIEAKRWSGPQIVEKIIENYEKFGSIHIVEDVGAQEYILSFLKELSDVPVVPFTTSAEKWDSAFGVESLAVELYNNKWIIPSMNGDHPEIEAWIEECLFFSPSAHTGDRLMACYFVREYIRISSLAKPAKAQVRFRVIGGGKMSRSAADEEAA